jgi:hypothetical protein
MLSVKACWVNQSYNVNVNMCYVKIVTVTFSACPTYSVICFNISVLAKFYTNSPQQPSFLQTVSNFSHIRRKNRIGQLYEKSAEIQTDLISSD